MGKFKWVAAGVAALSMLTSAPASAGGNGAGDMSRAEKLRRLDIMLMVTALRCRTTADNFQVEYGRFTSSHLGELNAASDAMKAQLSARYGAAGASRALDRMSTTMANAYGQGHPWLGCRDLKMVARNLAAVRGTATLEEAADQLLATNGSPQMAYGRR
jgi:hypothetical protein